MSVIYRTPADVSRAAHAGTERSYWLSVDLGQAHDPTAVAVIEKVRTPQVPCGIGGPKTVRYAVTYRCRHLERLPLRTSYPQVVEHVGRMLCTAPLGVNPTKLVLDGTGVGRPITDMFRDAGLKPISVTITAGDGWSREGDSYRVAKLLLVSRLQAALHSGLLHISAGLPEADVLKSELADFRVNHSASGYASFSAREGRHDDLVLAVAIGLWHAALPMSTVKSVPYIF